MNPRWTIDEVREGDFAPAGRQLVDMTDAPDHETFDCDGAPVPRGEAMEGVVLPDLADDDEAGWAWPKEVAPGG